MAGLVGQRRGARGHLRQRLQRRRRQQVGRGPRAGAGAPAERRAAHLGSHRAGRHHHAGGEGGRPPGAAARALPRGRRGGGAPGRRIGLRAVVDARVAARRARAVGPARRPGRRRARAGRGVAAEPGARPQPGPRVGVARAPDGVRRLAVLQRHRRRHGSRAVALRRHRRGHVPGEGHLPGPARRRPDVPDGDGWAAVLHGGRRRHQLDDVRGRLRGLPCRREHPRRALRRRRREHLDSRPRYVRAACFSCCAVCVVVVIGCRRLTPHAVRAVQFTTARPGGTGRRRRRRCSSSAAPTAARTPRTRGRSPRCPARAAA